MDTRELGFAIEPLARALELLADGCGLSLSPREAWDAAEQVSTEPRNRQTLARAAARVGLQLGACPSDDPTTGEGPAIAWVPGSESDVHVILLGTGRRRELVCISENGEQRLRVGNGKLAGELDRLELQLGGPLVWLQAEVMLPLQSIASREGQVRSPLDRLRAIARLERSQLGVVLVYAVAIGGLSLAVPVAAQALVNSVAIGSVLQPVVVLSVLLAGVLSFVGLLRVLEFVVVEAMQRRLFLRTAVDFARRLPRLSAAARAKANAPELANRFFDVVTLQKAGAKLLLDAVALILQLGVGMLLLAFYHPLLLAFGLLVALAMVALVFGFGRKAVSTAVVESDRKYAVAAWLEDLAAGAGRQADASARARADARTQLLGREWLHARREHFRSVLRQVCGGVGLQVVTATALLGIGGMLVIQRQLTLGQLVAAELVVAAIGDGLAKLGRQLESFYDASAAAGKLGKVVDLELDPLDAEAIADPLALRVAAPERSDVEPARVWPVTLDRRRALVSESRGPRAVGTIARLLAAGSLLLVLALALVPWQQSATGTGRVIAFLPVEREQTVQAAIAGRVERWYVQEGDRVRAGDRLAVLNDNDPEVLSRLEREREAALAHRTAAEGAVAVGNAKISALELAREAKQSSTALRVEMARSRLLASERDVDAAAAELHAAELDLSRQQQMFDEGLASKRRLELAQMEQRTTAAALERAKASLDAATREVRALTAEREHATADASADVEEARSALRKAESELAKAEASLQQVDVRLARQQRLTVVAPRDGTVLRLYAREQAEMLSPGDPLVAFVPEITGNAVELWVAGRDAPLIAEGRKVRLQFEGWPAVQFVGWPSVAVGTFGGVVEFVDASADETGRFRVVVRPDPDDDPWPEARWLRQGVRVNGWVLLDRVSLGFELWRQFNGFPPAVDKVDVPSKSSTGSKAGGKDKTAAKGEEGKL